MLVGGHVLLVNFTSVLLCSALMRSWVVIVFVSVCLPLVPTAKAESFACFLDLPFIKCPKKVNFPSKYLHWQFTLKS